LCINCTSFGKSRVFEKQQVFGKAPKKPNFWKNAKSAVFEKAPRGAKFLEKREKHKSFWKSTKSAKFLEKRKSAKLWERPRLEKERRFL
jgi:hypothetical protein